MTTKLLRGHVCLRGYVHCSCRSNGSYLSHRHPFRFRRCGSIFPATPCFARCCCLSSLVYRRSLARLPTLPCQTPLQRYPLRGRARSQTSPAPATVVPLSPVLPFPMQPFPKHPLVPCAAARRTLVRRLVICQDAARRAASIPRDNAHHDVARRTAARRDAA